MYESNSTFPNRRENRMIAIKTPNQRTNRTKRKNHENSKTKQRKKNEPNNIRMLELFEQRDFSDCCAWHAFLLRVEPYSFQRNNFAGVTLFRFVNNSCTATSRIIGHTIEKTNKNTTINVPYVPSLFFFVTNEKATPV